MTERDAENLLTTPSSESPPVQPMVQPSLLRQARDRQGVHLATLAVALKVPVARLEALEAGRYEELPDPTFVRALAKSVCKVLKVDPGPILASLPSAHVADLGPSATAISTPMPVSREGAIMGSGESMVRVPSAVLAAVILMAMAFVLWFLLPERTMTKVAEPTPAPQLLDTAAGGEQGESSSEAEASESAEESVQPPLNEAVVVAPSTVSDVAVSPGPELAQGVVQIKARDTVWVQIVGASGRVLLQRSLEVQESVAFSSDLPLTVVIGRADEVTVKVRDQDFDLQPWTRGNVARFEVQ
jgi:cytoskeleton protein RodZ